MVTNFQTKQKVTFECAFDCKIGAYKFSEGEPIKAVSDGMGRFNLYTEWADGSIGNYNVATINQLAGYQAVE